MSDAINTCRKICENRQQYEQGIIITQRSGEELQNEVTLLREMTNLLISYQKQCIDKLDLKGAKLTRDRIIKLIDKEQQLKDKIFSIAQDKQVMEMTQEQQDLINCFDKCWTDYLNQLVSQLATLEQKLKEEQASRKQQIYLKFDLQRQAFKPSTKLSNLKRKVFGLMKLHNYQQAQFESIKAKKLQQEQHRLWQQKIDERLKNALQLFNKKSLKQFEVLRSKNEDILFRKMNERDNKFSILLKKHQVKRVQAGRCTKQLYKSISNTSLNTKRVQ